MRTEATLPWFPHLLFQRLLYRLVTRTYRTARTIHVILDNYGIHDSLQVKLGWRR
jgi:hypothetical protein